MHWKMFSSATLKENVCTELRIRVCNEFFEVRKACVCIIEGSLVLLKFAFFQLFLRRTLFYHFSLARKVLGFKLLF